MGKRNKVTTRDIAEYAGVSQSTVSMILSEKKNVSFGEETVEKVKAAAEALGYRKPVKKNKVQEKSLAKTIIVLCPTLSNGYYNSVIHSIVEEAGLYGYTVMTAVTFRSADREEEYFHLLSENEIAGVITLYPLAKYVAANAIARNYPVISIGDKPGGVQLNSVELDSMKPGRLMAQYLLELGHRRLAFISSPITKKEISRSRRLEGLRTGVRDAGLDPDIVEVYYPAPKVHSTYPHTGAEYRTGYEMTIRALDAGTKATAFVGNSDDTALGILAALADRGLCVPDDYSVAGFDNNLLSSMPQISLTTVEHFSGQKGKKAVEMIYRRNNRRKTGDTGSLIVRMEYEPELIIRSTTGAPPASRRS